MSTLSGIGRGRPNLQAYSCSRRSSASAARSSWRVAAWRARSPRASSSWAAVSSSLGEPLVVGGLALEALGLRAVLVGALEALLGRLRASRWARAALASSCWRWPLGLGAQALAGALALDAAPGRGAVGEPRHDGDDERR